MPDFGRRALRRTALAGTALLLVFGVLDSAGASSQASLGAGPDRVAPLLVRTADGALRGFYRDGAREFLGVPFAAPPVGPLRWRPPMPTARWTGVRQATRPGDVCAQTGSSTGLPTTSTSEDCLYLNVYTPRRMHGSLPVMVWIHGGAFSSGAGSIYDGAVLAQKGDVIVVTINYRLGAFGFLALPALDAEDPSGSSGNFGLLDQQAALRWVQGSAQAFGGDPRNVTIFGQSAGAASVCGNMASPSAAGLFVHAIAESGCVQPLPSQQAADQKGGAFAASLGCADAATAATCLRTKPAAAVLAAQGADSWSPVVGGAVLPLAPARAFATGQYNHVPLLQGTNHDEGRFFVAINFDAVGAPLTAAQYPAAIAAVFGAAAATFITAEYPLSNFPSPDLALAAVLTDAEFSCQALRADESVSSSGVYAYEFDDPNAPVIFDFAPLTFPLLAAHSSELAYVLQRVPLRDTRPPFTPTQLALSNLMIRYWTAFAATGDPNAVRLPGRPAPAAAPWPLFTSSRQEIQELVPAATAAVPVSAVAADHHCSFWRGGASSGNGAS